MTTEERVTLKKKLSLNSGDNEEINRLLEGNGIDEILGVEKKQSDDEWVLSPEKGIKQYATAPNP